MNSNGLKRWGWLLQLLVLLTLVGGAVTAEAGTISGTVSNTSGRTGRVFLYLQQSFGGDTGIGVSIPAPAPNTPFTIRGVPDGTYTLNAFVDGSGTGRLHANDPIWGPSGTITINNNNSANSVVNFITHQTVAPLAPPRAMILPGDNGAFVGWDGPQSNDVTIADSYKVYYSTTSNTPLTTPDGVITVPAGDQAFAIINLPNSTPLHVQVTALVGATESTPTAVASTTINPPAAGFTISGTIDLSGILAPSGNLYLALIDRSSDGGGPVAVAFVTASPQLSNDFTIHTDSSNVPNGSYALFALIDKNGDGKIGSGDFVPDEQQAPTVTITGNDVSLASPITLTQSNASPLLNTVHWQDTVTPATDSYQVVIGAQSKIETIANITVTGGPSNNGLTYPIDLGINTWGSYNAWLNVNSNRPQLTDVYNLSIQYANIAVGPDVVNLPVTMVLDSFATPTAPLGYMPYTSVPDPSVFSWTAPVGPPSPYTYSFWTNANGFINNNDQYSALSSSTPSVSIPGLSYSEGQRYNWNINVQDSAGNQAQKTVWFSYTSGPGINSFSPTSILPGATLTISGINFSSTAANNTISFGCGASAQATTASTFQLQVVVPLGACSGSIRINASDYSYAQLTVITPMNISGKVTYDGIHGTANTYVVLIDSVTGIPASGIPAVLTDAFSGGYSISDVPAGSYKIYFSAGPGYQTQFYNNQTNFNSAAVLTMAGGSSRFNIDAILNTATNSGTIAGLITNATTSQPIYSAYIELLDTSNNLISSVAPVLSTSSGGFQLSAIPAGNYKLRVSASGYQTSTPVTVYTVFSNQVTPVALTLQPNPTSVIYTSKVTDSGSNPITGAQIDLIVGSTTTTNITSTDSSGMFSVVVPYQTSFYLRISKVGFVTTNTSMLSYSQDSDNSSRPYSLQTAAEVAAWYTQGTGAAQTAGTGTISGKIVSASNQQMTLADALVTASDGTTSYQVCNASNSSVGACSTSGVTSKANGKFYVLNIPAGRLITVTVSKSGYTGNTKNYQVAADTLSQGRIGLSTNTPSYTFTGKLVDTSSTVVPGATVTLIDDSNSTVGQLTTDSSGIFTVADLLASTLYYVKFSKTGYLDTYTANTSINSNTDKSNRPFTMYPTNQFTTWSFNTSDGAITGAIKDSQTGLSIGGATISASAGVIVYDDGSGPSTATSTSAANGRFYVRDVPAGSKVTVSVLTAPAGYDLTGVVKYYHVPVAGTLTQGSFFLSLKGTISATPSSIDFSSVPLGSSSAQQQITISNSGPGALNVFTASSTGDTSDFTMQSGGSTPCPSLPALLAPGQSCTLLATFAPTTTGPKAMTMSIASDASNSPTLNISLTGFGAAIPPGSPIITSITPWDGQATINFTPPNSDGGSTIQGYIISTFPAVTPVSGAGSPITISGLSNGQLYTVYITAYNGAGLSVAATGTTTPFYAPLRIGSTGYANNLQTLLAMAPAGSTIKAQAGSVTVTTPPLTLTQGITISGGYNTDYTAIPAVNGFTTIPGRVNIKAGALPFKVVFNNVKVMAP